MNRQIQARACAHLKNAQVLEHTPIYDLDAYLLHQKRQKSLKLRKNCFEAFTFLFSVVFTFSIFLGE
ncbi:hypothetical protein D9K79_08080 [Acinetobacter cumulans]|uniref:Uncharacterized protein n=1 Tax=Acinetobacter cumulans TaxID=2136182 RepID=A0ABX9U6B8_9GAMM|nr:hypothetical protein [Acinetobacter cumulans]RLL46400.1 hypothetical protein D9K79_08080 [Acinetobacter cumulans]